MLKIIPGKFNKIFNEVKETRKKLIRSGGLIALRDFIIDSGLIQLINVYIKDNRKQERIKYPISELLVNMILRILDGEKRIYNFRLTVNEFLYSAISSGSGSPHFNTFRYLLLRNKLLNKVLTKILLQFCLMDLKIRIQNGELKSITLDTDQTGKEIYGQQEGVEKGYFASGRGKKGFQIQLWTIREVKSLLKVELRSGEKYSVNGFYKDLRYLIKALKALGVPILVVGDSGYEDKQVMALLEDNGIKFIFAEKQRKTVKQRGKNAKNKIIFPEEGWIIKNRAVQKWIKEKDYTFTEIFVYASQVVDEAGQYLFADCYAGEFTNVFITNLNNPVSEVYMLYRKHAQVETIIEELKNEFGLGNSCNETFVFNQAMTQIIALTYNVKTFYLILLKEHLGKDGVSRMSTVRDELIHIPAMMVNEGNKKVLKFSGNGLKLMGPILKRFGYKVA